jgi:RimJ/RimL family protein N-acetyltransferase/8-oxo-dGTP pyrophosphatase MutT (NUDIX family)
MAPPMLRTHLHRLQDADLVLRPLTEDDWQVIAPWNLDPAVLRFSDGPEVTSRTLEEVRAIYRGVSHTPADVFVFEVERRPVGDGWVQHMNLDRVLRAFPERVCRRIDLNLDAAWWGRGIGTRAIALLTRHAFDTGADLVFACDIASDNPRSRRAFAANRYVAWRRSGVGAGFHRFDLVCRRPYFEDRVPVAVHPGPDAVRAGDDPAGTIVVVYRRAPTLELLLLHRAAVGVEHEGDWAWTPPAGARFPAEPPEEAVTRELHEETGIEAVPQRLDGVGDEHWWSYALQVSPTTVVELDEEHDRYQWVGPEVALRRCRPEAVRHALRQAIEAITGERRARGRHG